MDDIGRNVTDEESRRQLDAFVEAQQKGYARHRIGPSTLQEPGTLREVDFKPVITRGWVIKFILGYIAVIGIVWYLGWKYLGSGMTH